MAITLGSNVTSLQAQRQLFQTDQRLGTVFERLSSGQRINRASDDAAGLAISESLSTDRRVFNQGIRNLNDGLSLLNIADSTVEQLTGVATRIQELAQQASNGSLSSSQREALDLEAQALSSEFSRLISNAEFNDLAIFNGDLQDGVRLQAGYGVDGSIHSSLGGSVADGTFSTADPGQGGEEPFAVQLADLNSDGNLDLVAANNLSDDITVQLGNGDGTFGSISTYAAVNGTRDVDLIDLNGDGNLDAVAVNRISSEVSVLLGNGNGTFQASEEYTVGVLPRASVIGDINGDGDYDVIVVNQGSDDLSILLGNGNGTFQAQSTYSGAQNSPRDITLADFDGDSVLDMAVVSDNLGRVVVSFGNGNGTFDGALTITVGAGSTDIVSGDFNSDGFQDFATADSNDNSFSIVLGNGSGTFQSAQSYSAGNGPGALQAADVNADGVLDIIVAEEGASQLNISLGVGDGTFTSSATYDVGLTPNFVTLGDINNDDVLDIVTSNEGDDTLSILLGNSTDGISALSSFSLETREEALSTLSYIEGRLSSLSEQRGIIGAFQSRLQSALNTLGATSENYASAESRIRDADIAFESSQLTRLSILQQAAAAVLGQANQQPGLALELLTGRKS